LCFSNPEAVRYRYRLLGFHDEWSAPAFDNEIIFNNLPDGNYEFQLIADCGSEDTQTQIVSWHFTVTPAFWLRTWFLIFYVFLLMMASAGITIFFVQRKNKILLDKLRTEKELNELRIKSIRLKAIPHFNANVLAAIEYYILNLSKTEAVRLLGIYSKFTYQTLREVDKASRSLSEELEFVGMYLELEKLRFIDKFDYQIDVDERVNDGVQLPNMILHTYCENAVKHGLSSGKSKGLLKIKVHQSDNIVCVCVEDNGIGRAAAAERKNRISSKQGLDILSRQIEIYNRFNETKIKQIVEDLYQDGNPCGTRFTVEVPCHFNKTLQITAEKRK
jgi:LytS/YehU family sensor histidine kinase